MGKQIAQAMTVMGAEVLALNKETASKEWEFFSPFVCGELPTKQSQKYLLLSMRTTGGQWGMESFPLFPLFTPLQNGDWGQKSGTADS